MQEKKVFTIVYERAPSPWGNKSERLEDGSYLCEDASGAWTYDPETGDVDIVAMGGGTEWYNPAHRRRYVERMLRDGVPFPEWPDLRGRNEWLKQAREQGWPEPDADAFEQVSYVHDLARSR
jgi:hypothetical protein